MPVTTTVEGPAARIVIDFPDRRNALGPEEAGELADAIEAAGALDVSCLVLTGNGAFCAGGDLRAFAEVSRTHSQPEIEQHVYGKVQRITRALRSAPVPTIAAVDGGAIGLGMDIALACDMRFVGPGGFLVQGWARAGLIAGTGGVGLLQRLNPAVLWRLVASQERVDAEAAAALGLAEAATPNAAAAARARAAELSTIPRDVLSAYAELSRAQAWPDDAHFIDCARHQAGFIGSERFRQLAERVLSGAPSQRP